MNRKKMNEETVETTDTPAQAKNPPPGAAPTESELAQLREKAAQAEKNHENWLRAQANLENFRKRAAREREEIVQRANEHLIRDLLTVIDNFELALQSARETDGKEAILEGIGMIHGQLKSFLSRHGVEPIEAVGGDFDPSIHEAIAHQPSDQPAGRIIAQTRKGYRLKGSLLRPAAVVVSKGPE